MTISVVDASALAVWFDDDSLHVTLRDGRTVSAPLSWFPRLRDADQRDRDQWRLIGRGEGISWPNLDEDLSIAGLLRTE